ncbi:hypothetical protein SAMN04487971_103284 [Paracoccus chinensis]|uniref:Uncharacterized protein n=1 Tax=Paracoccus chinensis TaxID=525640 RepID=A0A1G9F8P1_9RHOB|nr:hypothetical protein SAMN04487971_103284 [Paracoccus chinensis]
MLVRPLDAGVVDIVARDGHLRVAPCQHQPRRPQARVLAVALEPVVARDQVPAARRHAEMAKADEAVVADLGVVVVDVQADAGAVLRGPAHVVGHELAAVDQQPLAGLADRGDAAILGAGEEAVAEGPEAPLRRQHHAAGHPVQAELDVHEIEAVHLRHAREVEGIAIAHEAVVAGARSAIQRLRQGQGAGGDVFRAHIDLAPDAGAGHARSDLDRRDLRHVAQFLAPRGVVGGGRGHGARGPGRAVHGGDLSVGDDAAGGKLRQARHDLADHQRLGQVHRTPAKIEDVVVAVIQQRLHPALHALGLVSEGIGIAGQVEVAPERQPGRARHPQLADKAHRLVHGQVAADVIGAGGNQHLSTRRSLVGALKGRAVVRRAVADRAIVAHVHPIDH